MHDGLYGIDEGRIQLYPSTNKIQIQPTSIIVPTENSWLLLLTATSAIVLDLVHSSSPLMPVVIRSFI